MKKSNPNKRTFAELEERRTIARYLYVEQNLSANQIAAETGMTQTSVSKWARTLNWDALRKEFQQQNKRPEHTYLKRPIDAVRAFEVYVKAMHPEQHKNIVSVIEKYINLVDLKP